MRLKRIIPDQLIGVLATGFFLFISLTGSWGLTGVLERITFDLGVRLAADEAQNPDIEIVAVTEEDLEELGRPPWPREVLARAVLNLAGAGAKVIAINMPFTEPEESKGLETVKSLKDKFESMGLAQDGPGLEFYKELTDAAKDLDSDRILAEAVREAGNVVLPVQFHSDGRGRDSVPPPFIEANALRGIRGAEDDWALDSVVQANKVKPLLPSFAEAAAGIGHSNVFPDPDGVVREQVPVVGYLGRFFFPSFPMAIAKAFKGLRDDDVAVVLGEGVQARANPSELVFIPARTDRTAALIKWSKGPDRTFRWTPFMTVFKNRIRTPLFRDKIVILGATAPELDGTYNTPINPRLPGVEVVANSTANIL
ncbi:MAG: CHASE2 domain-containing protein, partial [Desulfobacteraceae bacterium]